MKKGFTLAETLITLAIIGVVAALTIPVLVGKYQKRVLVAQLQKSFNTMQNAIYASIADNGDISSWPMENAYSYNGYDRNVFFEKYLIPYLKISKNCGSLASDTSCMAESYKHLAGEGSSSVDNSFTNRFILQDGSSAAVNISWGSTPAIYFQVDINGPTKGPNQYGRDFFAFKAGKTDNAEEDLKGHGLLTVPGMHFDDAISVHFCNPNGDAALNEYTMYCANRIIREGWKMNY